VERVERATLGTCWGLAQPAKLSRLSGWQPKHTKPRPLQRDHPLPLNN